MLDASVSTLVFSYGNYIISLFNKIMDDLFNEMHDDVEFMAQHV